MSLEKQTFTPRKDLGDDVFANSLGVNTGPTAPVEIEFERARGAVRPRPRLASVAASCEEAGDGGLTLSMEVCHDWALRSWILSWGPLARVLAPASLASEIQSDLQAASTRYASRDTPQAPPRQRTAA